MSTRSGRPPLKATFASLHSRNFRLYIFGQLVSQAGTWMQTTALSWYVLTRTHSAFALGTVSTFQFLPVLLFSLFGGVIADRLPKQRLIMVTQTFLAIQALVLAVLTSADLLTLPVLYLLAALQGTATAMNMPAQNAFVLEMVGPSDVPNAVALNSSMFQTTRLVGPALGGLAVATLGTAVCFYLNAASFLAVLLGLIMMDPSRFYKLQRSPRAAMLRQLGDGLRYAVTTPDILVAVITMAVLGTFGYNFQVFTPLVAGDVLHTNAVGFGLLNSALAVGSLTAALVVAWRGSTTRRAMLIGAGCFSIVLLSIGLFHTWLLLVPLFIGLGLSSSVFTATNRSRIQLITPTQLQGRMMSISTLLFAGSTPIGSLIVGGMAERAGVQPTVAAMGGMCILGVVAAMLYQRRVRQRLLPEGFDFDPERTEMQTVHLPVAQGQIAAGAASASTVNALRDERRP